MACPFVCQFVRGIIGKLFQVNHNADEVINSQCLPDSHSSWEFRDADKDGIAELISNISTA